MANLHRKLIQETINITISVPSCPSFCIPTNDLSLCSNLCLSLCSSICHYSIPSIIPPPDDPEYTPTSNHHPLNHHKLHPLLIITLASLATTFLLVSLYTIYVKFYSRRRRSSQSQRQPQPDDQLTHDNHQFLDEDHGPEIDHPIWYIRTVGLQPSVITAIAVCKYKRGDGLVEGTDCSVCLSEFQEDETLRLLPKCNHAFHIPCIDTWLQSHTNCPMCRAGIVATTIRSPSPELNVDNTDILEDTRVRISENDGEVGIEREDEVYELRNGGTEERSELRIENEGERCENSKERVGEIQPLRRSVSMDSLTASMISLSLANVIPVVESDNKSEDQLVKVSKSDIGNQRLLRIMGSSSSSIGRSLQNGPSSMKRSLSCTGKLLLSRYSRSRNSVLPF